MDNCIFCKIINGEIPSNKVYEDEKILAFHDLEPQAPVHVLIIPKSHLKSLNDISDSNENEIGHLMGKIKKIAELLELDNGYRLISNCGEDGLQTVGHLHFHLLGKRKMTWPPG